MLVVFNCGLNLREISLRRRYLETEFREIEAVADWIRENTPPESRIAIHMVLPFWTLSKLIQREVSDDYLWPADSTSPLSQQAQARACPDYLVTLMDPGPRTRPIPSRVLEPVFRTQTGRYRVLRVGSELGPPAREGARQRPADTNSR